MRRSAKRKYVKRMSINSLNIEGLINEIHSPGRHRLVQHLWDVEYGMEGQGPFYADGSVWHAPVDDVFYRVNFEGIPGEDFFPDAQGLALGCSVTAGCGLWHKWTWPYILSCELGYEVNSFGAPGRGLVDIIDRLFIYIRKYGKPKNLFILTPDIFRLRVLEIDHSEQDNLYRSNTYSWYTDFNSYAIDLNKGPHVYKSILGNQFTYPIELGIAQFVQEICRIETMCEHMDINLKIASWDALAGFSLRKILSDDIVCEDLHFKETDLFGAKGVNGYPEMFHTVNRYTEELTYLSCHVDHEIKENKYWSVAADNSHPGIHAQIHYAERFLGRPVSNRVLDLINTPLPDVEVLKKN